MNTLLLKVWKGAIHCPLEQWHRWGVRLLLVSAVMAPGSLALQSWQAQQPQYLHTTQTLTLQGQTFHLEVAETERQKQQGLQSRPPLRPSQGMLFPFVPAQSVAFWLWRTQPLDLVFLRQDTVVGLSLQLPTCTLMPDRCPLYHSPGAVTAVAELPAGAAQGVRVGDRVTFLPVSPRTGKSSSSVKEVVP